MKVAGGVGIAQDMFIGGEITVSNYNQHGGVGYAGMLTLTNTNATNSNKFVRINSTGALQIVDSLYQNTIFELTDAGALTVNGITVPSITKSGTSGSGDIGQTGNRFGTVWATTFSGVASTAQYADLAEKYMPDREYEPGTVVVFGGEAEVTIATVFMDTRIAGVVSTNPAYMMNSELDGGVYVALTGRVPCKVTGKIRKGDMLVAAGGLGVATASDNPKMGSVIGKALENYDSHDIGVIEVVVGRI